MTTLTFWIDVDNTLIDNDSVKKDYESHLQVEIGPTLSARFWELYEKARHECGFVNIPLSLQWLREQTSLQEMDEQTYLHVHSIFDNYPFFNALYPHALETLQYLRTLGITVIVSDGDLFFQAEKIFESGIAETVEGRVLIFEHKQRHIQEIIQQYPADHYVAIDDRPDILVDSKGILGKQVTTVFIQQGKYAEQKPSNFAPDISVLHIGDIRNYTAEQFMKAEK